MEEQNTPKKKKPNQSWENFVDQQIREAMERGDFDNLRGKGKPQELANHHGDPAQEMAHKIVKDAGFVPYWMELEKEIVREEKEAREAVLRSWRWCEAARGDAIEDPQWVAAEWRKAREAFAQKLTALNTKIINLNLQLPEPMLRKQRARLKLEDELKRLGIESEDKLAK
jgi:DnaJ family protein C protein 28